MLEVMDLMLVREANSVEEAQHKIELGQCHVGRAIIKETIEFTTAEYDELANNLLKPNPKIAGEGGYTFDGTIFVLRIKAPERENLYVDPEGYDYAVYVGFEVKE